MTDVHSQITTVQPPPPTSLWWERFRSFNEARGELARVAQCYVRARWAIGEVGPGYREIRVTGTGQVELVWSTWQLDEPRQAA